MSTNSGIERALKTATNILKNTVPSMGGVFTGTKGSTAAGSGTATGSASWTSGLGGMGGNSSKGGSFGLGGISSGPSFSFGSMGSMGSGSSMLKTAFYTVFFLFVLFITLCIIHFTITPIFYFSPGLPGYIYIPGGKDESELFWTTKQPNELDFHPRIGNPSDIQKFDINCTISVDIYIPNIVGVPIEKRLLFFKADKKFKNTMNGSWSKHTKHPNNPNSTRETFRDTLIKLNTIPTEPHISFIAYVDEGNKLCIDFYNNATPNAPWVTMGPFENTPVSEPFRVTLTIQKTIFEVYLNGKLAQTRYIQGGYISPVVGNEAIFPSPQEWRVSKNAVVSNCSASKSSSSSIQVLNLHYWSTRVLPSSEIFWMSPSLPTKAFFDSIGKDPVAPPPNEADTSMKTTDYPSGDKQCAKAPSYNPYKDIDLKSGFLLIAGLATAAYIFRPGSSQT